MREIIFRGKHTDTGEWVYGDLIHRILWDKSLIIIRTYDYSFDTYKDYDVIPESVGQFTGLCDKNGVKIFEGDIIEIYFFDKTRRNGELVEVKNTRTMVVEWHRSSFYMRELFRNYRLDKEMNIITEVIHDYKGDRKQGVYKSNSVYFVEVIGNIYDNPELIGE